jgi:hypothetical protein
MPADKVHKRPFFGGSAIGRPAREAPTGSSAQRNFENEKCCFNRSIRKPSILKFGIGAVRSEPKLASFL